MATQRNAIATAIIGNLKYVVKMKPMKKCGSNLTLNIVRNNMAKPTAGIIFPAIAIPAITFSGK
uniref:Uncharacterized protein n=1 Tax=Yersinia enterocolitica TaxID=630 RepID=B0RKR6_YEREN|nr:hypothetical protein [Yersinia enterocolitica]